MSKKIRFYIYIIPLILVFSCKKETVIERESAEMLAVEMQYAYSLLENNKKTEAGEIFEKVLYSDPNNSRAHLELAIIYHQTNDFINAMYHYRQYGKLQPNAQKFELIREQLILARDEFVYLENVKASRRRRQPEPRVREGSGDTNMTQALKEQITVLTEEAESLKLKISDLEKTVTSQAKVLRNRQATTSEYIVLVGDHLQGIALKVYGDESKWPILYNANRERLNLTTPNNIQVGQTLVIPWDKQINE